MLAYAVVQQLESTTKAHRWRPGNSLRRIILLQGQKIKQQDVSSWLTGIQEVPLSLQYKMRNIDETEAAKKRLLADAAPE